MPGFLFVKLKQIRTSDSIAGDGISAVLSIVDGLNAVGVLSSWSQTIYINTSRGRGFFSGRLAFLAGQHRQLGK